MEADTLEHTSLDSLLSLELKISRELKNSIKKMESDEARILVDTFYQIQNNRIRNELRTKSITDRGAPVIAFSILAAHDRKIESFIKLMLDVYTENHPIGNWMRSHKGIGPVIAAGFLANLNIEKARTAGSFWRHCGLDPSVIWYGREGAAKLLNDAIRQGGNHPRDVIAVLSRLTPFNIPSLERRCRDKEGKISIDSIRAGLARIPWNASLKRLCFLLGESFVKNANRKDSFYGRIYVARREYEWDQNLKGASADDAQHQLTIKKYGETTSAYKFYSGQYNTIEKQGIYLVGKLDPTINGGKGVPMLPPAHVNRRASRYAVRLFLSHLFDVWYEQHFNVKAPKPYAIAILEHAHEIPPPNFVSKYPDDGGVLRSEEEIFGYDGDDDDLYTLD